MGGSQVLAAHRFVAELRKRQKDTVEMRLRKKQQDDTIIFGGKRSTL
jgi:hypothetical protein